MPIHARLTLVAICGLAWWFFGNAYEAFVISPNWVHESAEQVGRLNTFFKVTSPTHYFVPITPLATLLVWWLAWRNREPSAKPYFMRASVLIALATALNVLIVSTVILRLFGRANALSPELTHELTVRWNYLNLCRIALVGAVITALFQAFRRLDRLTLPA
jgi:hypothetical protein